MSKRPTSPNGSVRVDAILRYRSAHEGVLCSSRCRELSRAGLTATVDRPVSPGELLRIDLEPPLGGPSVLGLARVSWTGGDPDGAPGSAIMRLRFVSLGEASQSALGDWLRELGSAADRLSDPTKSPYDDSSVRALSRAITDSLLPPPPVLPGAPPSTESSGLSPVPVVVPNRPSIPPPPGMYARTSQSLSHPVDRVAPAVHSAMATARRSSRPPPDTSALRGLAVSEPEPIGPAAKSRVLRETSASRRTAEVRERLNRLQRRRDNTPLAVPLERAVAAARAPFEPPTTLVARATLAPPLPLGALLNAPPETTRRSSPPPPLPAEPAPGGGAFSSSSWPALRVPPSVAAVAEAAQLEGSPPPAFDRPSRETIPPPASIPEMPPLHVAPTPVETLEERASLPIDGPSLPLSDAPWSVPAPARRASRARPWLVLCLGSLAVGAGLAYLAYAPSLARRGQQGAAAQRGPSEALTMLGPDELLAPQLTLPEPLSIDDLPPLAAASGQVPTARPPASIGPLPKPAPAPIAQPVAVAPRPSMRAEAAPAGAVPGPAVPALASPAPASAERTVAVGSDMPPPPPQLPAALGGPAPPLAEAAPVSRLERARACVARGDMECASELLKKATTEPELELWIETLRAQGQASEARSAMQRFVEAFPAGRRTPTYRRILSNAP